LSLSPGFRLPYISLEPGTATIDREPEMTASHRGSADTWKACGAAGWLALAASPTFALMAWIAANDAPRVAFCFSGQHLLPIDGMTEMYLLMSLFHLSPWLKLASASPGAPA